ncbi:hypothetical protein LTR62_006247 [Meristemomyces frigidus]|uniref:G-patch domain-containing protein n=1 Tax=Meristemomyces frigidus TaxID=1508187 RepID=A0AAN7TCA4_9PEZI|nr:hypothetical protein LTR62_006247 [Meristemomyces frigidus]
MSTAPKKMGLSLYANLLNTDKQEAANSTISGAPVKYNVAKLDEEGEAAAKKKDGTVTSLLVDKASLQFQPVRRPQAQPKKKPPGHAISSSVSTANFGSTATSSPTPAVTRVLGQQPRSNFEDWVGGEDDEDDFYVDNRPKRERGGRNKKKKKGGAGQDNTRSWNWDDIYDPTMPNNYADYKGSDEQMMENRDWKARLYYHRLKEAKKSSESEAAGQKQAKNGKSTWSRNALLTDFYLSAVFPPPNAMSFAPPSFNDVAHPPLVEDDDEHYPAPVPSQLPDKSDSYKPSKPMGMSNGPSHEDAHLLPMQLGVDSPARLNMLPRAPAAILPNDSQAPDSAASEKAAADIAAKKAEAAAKIAAFEAKVEAHKAAKVGNSDGNGNATISTPDTTIAAAAPPAPSPQPSEPEEPGNTISRAPVRYQLPPSDLHAEDGDIAVSDEKQEEDAPRSLRPGQKGFAERLLKKYGWEKGQGLGAEGNEGITTAIVAKAEKRKKLADAQGGGWAQPVNMGKLVGGKRRKVAADGVAGDAQDDETQPYGPLSAVIKLEGMLNGLDIDEEVQNKDLYGEIGREMEGQYGKVERVYIWREAMGGQDQVFVKFTSQLSALRAVGACDGMEFAGNEVQARFFDGERFEKGEYA